MKLLPLLLFICVLVSCENEANLSYKVRNDTSSILKVISINDKGKTTSDTFLIPANDQQTIAINLQGTDDISNYKELNENLRDFRRMDIFLNETVPSTTDFLKSARWMYDEKNNRVADYLLIVTESDF